MNGHPNVEHNVSTAIAHRSFLDRMKGAAFLDVDTYEEVEADTSATAEAGGVVALVAVASAIGASGAGTTAIIGGLVAAVVGWLLWAGITYLVGDKMLGGTATWGELLRTLGFAQSPGILLAFGAIPGLHVIVSLLVGVWQLVTCIIAIRQALDFGTGKAILTAITSVIVIAIINIIVRI
jgi:hypothetical protein